MREFLAGGLRHATAFIDQAAMRANLALARSKAPHAAVLAMIKANAYGHGMLAVADCLAGHCEYYGVARLTEAEQLRAHGCEQNIVVFGHGYSANDIAMAAKLRLTPCLYSAQLLDEQLQQCHQHKLPFWLKLDTGMHRLGIPESASKCIDTALASPLCEVVLTHLHSADEPGMPSSKQQLQRFSEALKNSSKGNLERKLSIANSAFLMQASSPSGYANTLRSLLPAYAPEKEIIRPGIMLYGANPLAQAIADEKLLSPVMTMAAPVIDVKAIARGESVGYGATWRADNPGHIATIAAGYADGYPRHAENGTPVEIHGVRCPLAGRVSMDSIGVDISALIKSGVQVHAGDSAVLWGATLRVEEVAACAGTISYQLLTGVSARVERVNF
ncbi:MAG: alanine racemase [Gammaproteobacteria bacterium]|nr:alanine racemase [Gammaproteobacteria bacterium]NND38912.1 alanine racemase [Pseudomonadales bacterium]NNL10752.1 alanine racemase [Pseudomonadales bacterium]